MWGILVAAVMMLWGVAFAPVPAVHADKKAKAPAMSTNRTLGPKVDIRPGNPFSPGHPQNDGKPFSPQPSAAGTSSLPGADLGDNLAAAAGSTTLANVAQVKTASARYAASLIGAVTVLQANYPTAVPVLLSLESRADPAFIAGVPLLAGPIGLPARVSVSASAGAGPEGRFIITWGVGASQFYAFTDFASGTFQIPAANSIVVYAHVYGPQAPFLPDSNVLMAAVTARPGLSPFETHATYTRELRRSAADAGDVVSDENFVPPYARTWSAEVADNSGIVTALADRARLRVRQVNGISVFGEYITVAADPVAAGIAAPGYSSPVETLSVPLSMAGGFDARLVKDVAGGCGAAMVFEIGP